MLGTIEHDVFYPDNRFTIISIWKIRKRGNLCADGKQPHQGGIC